mgnify:CR=1
MPPPASPAFSKYIIGTIFCRMVKHNIVQTVSFQDDG